MADRKEYAAGMYWDEPCAKAPEWVIGNIGVHRDRLVEWLGKQSVNEKGYLRLTVAEKRDGDGASISLDTWQPKKQEAPVASGDPFNDDIPW